MSALQHHKSGSGAAVGVQAESRSARVAGCGMDNGFHMPPPDPPIIWVPPPDFSNVDLSSMPRWAAYAYIGFMLACLAVCAVLAIAMVIGHFWHVWLF